MLGIGLGGIGGGGSGNYVESLTHFGAKSNFNYVSFNRKGYELLQGGKNPTDTSSEYFTATQNNWVYTYTFKKKCRVKYIMKKTNFITYDTPTEVVKNVGDTLTFDYTGTENSHFILLMLIYDET